jgi:hypothetical protein
LVFAALIFIINCAVSCLTLWVLLHQKKKRIPVEKQKTKLKQGEHVFFFKDELMTMKWRDKKRHLSYEYHTMIQWFQLGLEAKTS